MSASVSAFWRASVRPERRRGDQQVHRFVRVDRVVDDPVRLDLERQHVAAVLGAGGGLGAVQRPLVQREDHLLGLGLDLGAELHPLGEDDLFLGGEQRHAADLTQVQAHGVVRVEDLGRDRLGLIGVRFGRLGGRGRNDRLGLRLGPRGHFGRDRREGLRLKGGDLGIELDRRRREGGLSLGDRCSRRIGRNHDAPTDGVAPSRATTVGLFTTLSRLHPRPPTSGPRHPTYVVACQIDTPLD